MCACLLLKAKKGGREVTCMRDFEGCMQDFKWEKGWGQGEETKELVQKPGGDTPTGYSQALRSRLSGKEGGN